jgi:hypothetical protein
MHELRRLAAYRQTASPHERCGWSVAFGDAS